MLLIPTKFKFSYRISKSEIMNWLVEPTIMDIIPIESYVMYLCNIAEQQLVNTYNIMGFITDKDICEAFHKPFNQFLNEQHRYVGTIDIQYHLIPDRLDYDETSYRFDVELTVYQKPSEVYFKGGENEQKRETNSSHNDIYRHS